MRGQLTKWLGLDDVPDAWPQGVDEATARRALDQTLLHMLRPLSALVGWVYVVQAVLHVTLQTAPLRWIMGAFALASVGALFGTHLLTRRGRLPARHVGATILALSVVTFAQSLAHAALNPMPALTAVPVVIVLLASLFLPSLRLLLLFQVAAAASFLGVSLHFWPRSELPYHTGLLATSLATGLPLHLFLQTLLLRLHAHRLADRDRTAELETAVSALEAVRNKYELLARNVSDVIWIRDLQFNAIYISPSVLHLRGYSAPEVMTQPPEQIFSPESLERARAWIAKELLADPKSGADPDRSRVVELQVPHRDGRLVWTEARVRFLRDADGTPIGLVGTSRDISDRKAAEQRLAQVLEELRRSNQELEQFAYIASHDLKEPLRVVASQLRMLERRCGEALDERGQRYLGHAVEGAVRMQELIDGLLAYSRYGASSLTRRPVPLEAVLQEVSQSLSVAIEESAVKLTVDPLPRVDGDRQKLTHLFQNLVANAVKFRRAEGPAVTVGVAEQSADAAVIFVRDNGIGVDPQHHDRIFRLFERLHTREEYEGTGIGLALCRRIVEQHGGRIWLESAPGEGTTFFCQLPLPTGATACPEPGHPPDADPVTPMSPAAPSASEPSPRAPGAAPPPSGAPTLEPSKEATP